jgi:hypothetical protein
MRIDFEFKRQQFSRYNDGSVEVAIYVRWKAANIYLKI